MHHIAADIAKRRETTQTKVPFDSQLLPSEVYEGALTFLREALTHTAPDQTALAQYISTLLPEIDAEQSVLRAYQKLIMDPLEGHSDPTLQYCATTSLMQLVALQPEVFSRIYSGKVSIFFSESFTYKLK